MTDYSHHILAYYMWRYFRHTKFMNTQPCDLLAATIHDVPELFNQSGPLTREQKLILACQVLMNALGDYSSQTIKVS